MLILEIFVWPYVTFSFIKIKSLTFCIQAPGMDYNKTNSGLVDSPVCGNSVQGKIIDMSKIVNSNFSLTEPPTPASSLHTSPGSYLPGPTPSLQCPTYRILWMGAIPGIPYSPTTYVYKFSYRTSYLKLVYVIIYFVCILFDSVYVIIYFVSILFDSCLCHYLFCFYTFWLLFMSN